MISAIALYTLFRTAESNEEEALARQLAAQSDNVRHQPGKLMLSTLLAIESARRVPLFENGLALESTLALAGRPLFHRPTQHSAVAAGSLLATIGDDGAAYLWDAMTGTQTARLDQQSNGQPLSPSFSVDGRWLVTTTPGDSRLWEASSGRQVAHLDAGEEFLAVGEALVVLGRGGEPAASTYVRVLDPATGRERRRYAIPVAPELATARTLASANGKRIAVANAGSIEIMDASTGTVVRSLK